jgi:hypothetical protein
VVVKNKGPAVQATGGSGMSQDTIWQIIRYVLIAAGSFFAGKGWVTEDQWLAIVSALGGVFAVLWGLYVKWNTLTVPADVPGNARTITGTKVPTVSPLTGQIS